MTFEEFKECVERGYIIRCQDVEQRFRVLKLLVSMGYKLSPQTRTYLGRGYNNDIYLNPCFDKSDKYVFCYSKEYGLGKQIQYSQILEIVEPELFKDLEIPDDDEFNTAFQSLLSSC